MKTIYNKTQLSPDKAFERHVYHRDMFAHYLRFSHILKIITSMRGKAKILDIGCGSGNLAEVLYRNKQAPARYVGTDVRSRIIKNLKNNWKHIQWAEFIIHDVVKDSMIYPMDMWDFITCFEVMEHIGKDNGPLLLNNVKSAMNENTVFMLSTPVYDPVVGAAKNHIINGEICEYQFDELENLLKNYFQITDVFGTFASKKNIMPRLSVHQLEIYYELEKYYDVNLLSVLFAPMFPPYSRNCLWKLKLKRNQLI